MGEFSDCRCLVVGAGEMGQAHVAALKGLGVAQVAAFAPSRRNAAAITALGAEFFSGDFGEALEAFSPTHGLIAAPVEQLAGTAEEMIGRGIRSLLIEKPAALSSAEGEKLLDLARETQTDIVVGYNRRYYGPVEKALAMIRDSGEAVSSVVFEFTEWSHVIAGLTNQSKRTKARWLLANSMHVIDSAFLPVGLPDVEKSRFVVQGQLDWHPSGSAFAGSGVTQTGVPFSYCANWDAPGRWGFEWLTASTRYIFRPMEKLHVTRRGSVAIEEIALDDDLDERFKPGLFRQNAAWLRGQADGRRCDLSEAVDLIRLAGHIGGYEE